MKLFVTPHPNKQSSGGVFEVIKAHQRELCKLGVEYVESEKNADLVIMHALARTTRHPDVYHSHGFYPTAQVGWGGRFNQVNEQLFQSMMTARKVVSVSELAAEVMRRDFHIQPEIIRNGVNFSEIQKGGKKDGYILWPKIDINPTCDPTPFLKLAKLRPDLRLASIVNLGGAIKSFGRMPHKVFLSLLQDCAIYLGVTRENCSMGTMEAMSTGIPVVGFDWGFNREWLEQGNGCWLVEPGDIEGLAYGIDMVTGKFWSLYSKQAREFAKDNFGWDEPIQQIYDLYSSLLKPEPTNKVSVIIPLHNYANWVGEAIQSAKDQTVKPLEIIVVDDASTDNPILPKDVRLIRLKSNVGVAQARNIGIERAKGNLIICLDADDKLAKDYIQRALPKFKDLRTGIAYGPLSLVDENGQLIGKNWFDAPFYWNQQAIGHNRIPTCCMFRKVAWERAGGFRTNESPAEDAGLWTRIASQGWKVEFLSDGRSTLFYRMHDNSLSRTHKFPDWVSGREWKRRNAGLGNPVQIYDCPKVSFVMDYVLNREQDFIRSVDSIEGLAAIDWEICATGKPTPQFKAGFPFVRWGVESSGATRFKLEAGDVLNGERWANILQSSEFPNA